MNKRAVIFDMDGLLIDSERFWIEQDIEFLEKRNIPLTSELLEEVKVLLSGNSVREGSKKLIERFGLDESLEDLVEERENSTKNIYTHLAAPLPGVQELFDALRSAGVPMAIGSGSSANRIEEVVERFGWRKYMGALVSSDHVGYRGKPAPDIFLLAAENIGVDPAICTVFEDSLNGVRAAKRAGMKAIAIPREINRAPMYEEADLIVPSLRSKEVYEFLDLPYV